MNPIQSISTTQAPAIQRLEGLQKSEDSASFKDYLLQSIQEVNSMQQAADQAVEKLFTGGEVNPAEVLTAVQKADIAFRMMLQVRNKLVAAYEEVQQIRV
jgi:flagellar hook-basal body complex protein FliE